ncbi:integral membrane sensor signal transduction histidine kinase [Bacteroides coprosuis DSM 18011]|uniref:histidine kinase n=1 Tax=Bacteroides coprosuis DSM 18011 TaxID=679937 RepID=F3ZTJ1_9BACE|nr:HAMP domain-containing sensor histidine kinase [Bacteroides coprosuis]EGJ71081.1 integral membrane sensor signal transduction histidine kinase [Bacteroides coprosuis DSM 18011]
MKIRNILALRFTSATAIVLLIILGSIYFFSEQSRYKEFYRDLKREAITKANLFLDNRVDAKTMQSIYLNNREFINEVEVAIYSKEGKLLYHDAIEIDIVKETTSMIQQIIENKELKFNENKYEAVGLVYSFNNKDYIITAAAYDGYGHSKQASLQLILLISAFIGLGLLLILGYIFAKNALAPVSKIVEEAERITASNLDLRIPVNNPKDELGELSMTFNNMLDRLEQAFESQRQFISNVSHELRTPMAALTAELEIALLKERNTDEYKKAIEYALNDTKEITKLSSGLLDLAKASYQPEQIKMSNVRFDELLLDARNLVIKANPDYKVELIFEQIPEDERFITVYGNSYLLKTALVNLMENNCKFSKNKSSMVQITYWNNMSIVRLSDTGIGISPSDLEHLFIPFYRGKNKNYAKGYGIGMTLCQQIVQIHKGQLQINSEEGVGTTYLIEIPHI